jgi:heme oxygenase
MHADLSVTQYGRYLQKTLGFYIPVEEALSRQGAWEVLGLSARERTKVPLLLSDLVMVDLALLGGDERLLQTPVCDAPPELRGVPEAIGCAYVLEGSTLGGRVISRHVQRCLGSNAPRAFLEGYAEQTGANWQAFRAAVLRFARSRDVEDRVIAGARLTFRAFERWLTLLDRS